MKYVGYSLLIVFSLVITLAIIEIVIRLNPGLTPNWYKTIYPPNAIEVFYPGTLAKTPIYGVPVPYNLGPKKVSQKDTVPSDLVKKGLLDVSQNPDLSKYSEIVYRIDKNGFMNPHDYAEPDIVFIGDSFSVAASTIQPKGLLLQLEEITGQNILSIAVPAIGPQREEWLLNNIALPLKPKAIIWFFFAGNDLYEAKRLDNYKKSAIQNYNQIFDIPAVPRIITLDLISKYFDKDVSSIKMKKNKQKNYLPGLQLSKGDKKELLWFLPKYLKRLSKDKTFLYNHKGWKITKEVLLRVSETLNNDDIKFLVVYVPSKPEVYLPYIDKDIILLQDYYTYPRKIRHNERLKLSADSKWQELLKNRNNLEELMKEFCDLEQIPFITVRPQLEELAMKGELGFLSADTHWNEIGQESAAKPIANWINVNLKN